VLGVPAAVMRGGDAGAVVGSAEGTIGVRASSAWRALGGIICMASQPAVTGDGMDGCWTSGLGSLGRCWQRRGDPCALRQISWGARARYLRLAWFGLRSARSARRRRSVMLRGRGRACQAAATAATASLRAAAAMTPHCGRAGSGSRPVSARTAPRQHALHTRTMAAMAAPSTAAGGAEAAVSPG